MRICVRKVFSYYPAKLRSHPNTLFIIPAFFSTASTPLGEVYTLNLHSHFRYMANCEHLARLLQGVEAWNSWREENSDESANLHQADLSRMELSEVDLRKVNLRGANLSEAILDGAYLGGAILVGAHLENANLCGANLGDANLDGAYLARANLVEANLDGAHLCMVDFSEAILSKADLRGAHMSQTNLSSADLTEANLVGADLSDGDLRASTLFRANLRNANLDRAQLGETNLIEAHLDGTHIVRANFVKADLREASFRGANLSESDFSDADLSKTDLTDANLSRAIFRCVKFIEADLNGADLSEADLYEADLNGASLIRTTLINTNLEKVNLTNCNIYGISAWGINSKDAIQKNLTITPEGEPVITVDELEVAQFVYLLLNNAKIRNVIETIAKKAVLILGRFTPERKAVLEALRSELRQRGYLPILFDFEKPSTKGFTETIKILAGMSLFVIADISNPRSSPLELQATIPDYMVPFVPIIQEGEEPFSMFKDLHIQYKKWVLTPLEYDSVDNLIMVLDKAIIEPALQVQRELLTEKAAELPKRNIKEYMS